MEKALEAELQAYINNTFLQARRNRPNIHLARHLCAIWRNEMHI